MRNCMKDYMEPINNEMAQIDAKLKTCDEDCDIKKLREWTVANKCYRECISAPMRKLAIMMNMKMMKTVDDFGE